MFVFYSAGVNDTILHLIIVSVWWGVHGRVCVCVRAYVYASVCACMHAWMYACMCVSMYTMKGCCLVDRLLHS